MSVKKHTYNYDDNGIRNSNININWSWADCKIKNKKVKETKDIFCGCISIFIFFGFVFFICEITKEIPHKKRENVEAVYWHEGRSYSVAVIRDGNIKMVSLPQLNNLEP